MSSTKKATGYLVETSGKGSGYLKPVAMPELVFGLVGPLGANLPEVTEQLSRHLARVGYQSKLIRLSELMHELKGYSRLKRIKLEENRINEHMNAGNEIRTALETGGALALLAVGAIRNIRREVNGDPLIPIPGTAYILRSLKHPDEVNTLRKVYGGGFFQISVGSPREARVQSLNKAIARSHNEPNETKYRPIAEQLIQRDEQEEDLALGQNVRHTFPEADVMIGSDNPDIIQSALERFINILFRQPFITPSKDEFGMNLAKAVSLRSADLSRQVGAVIMTADGEVIATGCNEVPKAGGGQYWFGDQPDVRDFISGVDPNYVTKREMVGEVIKKLKVWFSSKNKKIGMDDLLKLAIGKDPPGILSDAQIMDVLEFGRVVHAEMAAISEAARLGRSVKGAVLYCTTFPCHICARHIIASGIARVVYIEPYPKSKATAMYPDSIAVDGLSKATSGESVRFDSFVGVAPKRFRDLFAALPRKTNGRAVENSPQKSNPRLERLVPAYLQIEAGVVSSLGTELARVGLEPTN
jgi:deoxycytidylate deaminase